MHSQTKDWFNILLWSVNHEIHNCRLFVFSNFAIAASSVIYVNGGYNNKLEDIEGSFNVFRNAVSVKYGKIPYNNVYLFPIKQNDKQTLGAITCQATLAGYAGGASVKHGVGTERYLKALGDLYISPFSSIYPECNTIVVPGVFNMFQKTRRLSEEITKRLNDGVVLVGHSQGNMFIEAAIGMIASKGLNIQKIKTVNIASMAPTTLHDYINHDKDTVLYNNENAVVRWLLGKITKIPNVYFCLNECTKSATIEELISITKDESCLSGCFPSLNQRSFRHDGRPASIPDISAGLHAAVSE